MDHSLTISGLQLQLKYSNSIYDDMVFICILIRFYIDEIDSIKQQLRVTKDLLEESEEKSAALEGELQRYVVCVLLGYGVGC